MSFLFNWVEGKLFFRNNNKNYSMYDSAISDRFKIKNSFRAIYFRNIPQACKCITMLLLSIKSE
jgi:hypothetical protein